MLTRDYLQCFKKGSSRISEMGGFIFKIRLAEVTYTVISFAPFLPVMRGRCCEGISHKLSHYDCSLWRHGSAAVDRKMGHALTHQSAEDAGAGGRAGRCQLSTRTATPTAGCAKYYSDSECKWAECLLHLVS